jgi:PAS domain S-box-containing protein
LFDVCTAACKTVQSILITIKKASLLLMHYVEQRLTFLMRKIPENSNKKQPGISKKFMALATAEKLYHQAFDNSVQANIIFTVSSGEIVLANSAACKLLGYSKKELQTKSRDALFDINESGFKKMLKEQNAAGKSSALITAIQKSGKRFPCELTLAVFKDADGIKKVIITIANISQRILKQKNIDTRKERIVADNIVLAKSRQREIDIKKEKIVADNILLAQERSDDKLEKNNEWIKYIAKTSYDVMWDWNIATGEIYVGDSIEEVFGYNAQNNTVDFSGFCQCLLPEEKETIEMKLLKTLVSDSKSWDDSYNFKRQDGSVAYTNSRASIVRDEEGKAVRLIGAIRDVSRLQELEKKLEKQIAKHEEDSEKFLLAAKLSFDVIWDWNLTTDDMFIGEGFEELYGYPIKKNRGTSADLINHFHPDDKEVVEKGLHEAIISSAVQWEQAFRFIRADGSVAKVFNRASIIRHADGKAYRMIGAMQDLSRQKELEEKLNYEVAAGRKLLTKHEEYFKLIFNLSSDILYDVDLATNYIIVSDLYEKEFGYKTTNNTISADGWFSHIHPEDKAVLMQDYHRMLLSKDAEWKYSFRYIKADRSVANIVTSCVILRNHFRKAYRQIGYMQDITKQKALQEKLEQEITLRELQIAEAAEEAKKSERSDIGKELHDNVNQLLGASRLYLDMAKGDSKNSEMYLSRSSEYTLRAIEEIGKLATGLTADTIKTLGLYKAVNRMARDTMAVNPVKISCTFERFKEADANDIFKLDVFRIVQEQLNNIIKHAKATKVDISLLQNKKSLLLCISDDGIGFDTRKTQKGIGMVTIKSRAIAYNGTAAFVSQPGQGCVLTVTFPVSYALLNENLGFTLIDHKKSMLVEKIKNTIVELVHYSDEQPNTNSSDYITKKLKYDYTYLANVFSKETGTTIEKFIITQKIERVKELLIYGELNLTQIALKLHYSSVAHLSNQFRQVTGFTPSSFKQQKHQP